MLRCILALLVTFSLAAAVPASARTCFSVNAKVVSLGERNARAYADRRLAQEIESRKSVLETTGRRVSEIKRDSLSCAPYPNILGADEWQCAGSARVCASN